MPRTVLTKTKSATASENSSKSINATETAYSRCGRCENTLNTCICYIDEDTDEEQQ